MHLPCSFLRKSNLTSFTQNEREHSRPNIWVFCRDQYANNSVVLRSTEKFIAINTEGNTLVFVHAKNNYIRRRELWQNLSDLQESNICIMGDFNVVLGAHERSSGMITHGPSLEEFQNFITQNDLVDVEAVGALTIIFWLRIWITCWLGLGPLIAYTLGLPFLFSRCVDSPSRFHAFCT